MREQNLEIPVPMNIPTTAAEIDNYRMLVPIVEDLRKRKAAHLDPVVSAINMVLGTIDQSVVAKLRQNALFRTAEQEFNLYNLWVAIPTVLEDQGAPALIHKSEIYIAYVAIKMAPTETLTSYNERWRLLRAQSAALKNVEQTEQDLAHRYVSSLCENYKGFINYCSQRAVPFANLTEAVAGATAWKIDSLTMPSLEIGATAVGASPTRTIESVSAAALPATNEAQQTRNTRKFRGRRDRHIKRDKRVSQQRQDGVAKPMQFPKSTWNEFKPDVQEAIKIANDAARSTRSEGMNFADDNSEFST
jgi:hypothetical protein